MYIICVKVIAVPSQDSERSCILCVLRLSRKKFERSCINVLMLSSKESERSCINVLRLSSKESERHLLMC